MRLILISSFMILGCATKAPITYQEECATKGLVLQGITSGSGRAFHMGSGGNWVTSRGTSESISCDVPKTPTQSCEADRLSQVAQPKMSYNQSTKLWNLGIGAGYIFYILPGVGLKLLADNKLDKAVAESHAVDQATRLNCSPPPKDPNQGQDQIRQPAEEAPASRLPPPKLRSE